MKVKVMISNAGNLQRGLLNNELDLALIEGGFPSLSWRHGLSQRTGWCSLCLWGMSWRLKRRCL